VWVSGVVPAHTVGGSVTPGMHKLLLMSPGLVLGGALVARRYVLAFRALRTVPLAGGPQPGPR
jgi:hypothetical protein